jgi:tetratricopeptide (TPR) repeat protein
LQEIWRPIQETWGAAREAQNWPAQRLLDYGNAILDSLRPGMIYAGGTDPGCFIPTMMNETGDGEQHIVLTQNALADGTYLKYLDVLYGDRMTTLTQDDSQRAFQEYIADAQKRLEHDQQFPNEPAQLKPGEDVKSVDGKVQVSGQVAVMAINEKLFRMLMAKNPDAAFAMEESFPFNSLYGSAKPLGPIIEMGAPEQQWSASPEQVTQSVDYWRTTADQLLADPDTPEGSDARKAYSKLISSQAGLLVDHQLPAEAEQEFRIALEISPESPEAVFRYVNLLMSQNRTADALPVVERAIKAAPDNNQLQGLRNSLNTRISSQGH